MFDTFKTRSWRKFDKDAFKQDLADSKLFSENANWAECTIDELFSSYDVTLRSLLDKHQFEN